jgi:hypothetical protein
MTRPARAVRASALTVALTTTLTISLGLVGSAGAIAAPSGGKHLERPTVRVHGHTYAAPNPYLAEMPSGMKVDWAYWRRHLDQQGLGRQARRTASPLARVPVPTAAVYREQEPAGTLGRNDSYPTLEPLENVGIGKDFRAARISGRLSTGHVTSHPRRTHEDQGSIPQATRTGIGTRLRQVHVASRIGDGPHGRHGDGHGDYDFFRLHAVAGQTLHADTLGSRLDTVLAVYGRRGHVLAFNDDDRDLTSAVSYAVSHTGYYYVMVGGFSWRNTPRNPFRARSGAGAGDEGTYRLRVFSGRMDKDVYGVHLDSGDVLGGTLRGAAREIRVTDPQRRRMVGSQEDASFIYPPESPLPGGGPTFAYVAQRPGWYAVSAQGGQGDYGMRLEVYRPGSEQTATGSVQTIFLDFNGERVNTGMFGGFGVRQLSPLRTFLPRWRLTAADESAVEDAVIADVKENLQQTLADQGLNDRLQVRVLNSRDDADPWGEPNVSRVVVGGSIRESGIPTIGISQSIDPGNFAHEETSLVLLDEVASPSGAPDSFNTYLRPGSDRTGFVGQALGNVVSHEVGHLIGSFHTDNGDRVHNLMDAGGRGYAALFGVGPDGVGGTTDDTDVDFGVDRYLPEEGFTGQEDTLNNSAWAFVPGAQ